MQRAVFQQSRWSQRYIQKFGPAFTMFSRWGYLCIPITLLLGVAVVIADDTRSNAGTVSVNSSVTDAISEAGDVDYWRIEVPSDGQLVVETTGDTDTIGVLEDSAGNQIEEHDDQDLNTNRNFKIDRAVTADTYYIRVRAYRNHTGDYTLHVSHVPADDGSDDSDGEDEGEGDDEDTQTSDVNLIPSLGDLNGDGRDDVLLRHTDGRWYYYPMDGREHQVGESGAAFLTGNLAWQLAGIGDLNGDGRDDVLLRHREDGRWQYYPMNGREHIADQRGSANITSDLAWQLAGIGDLNGDGKDDVLLRHHEDGRWLYYPMDGREHIADQRGTADISSDLALQLAGIGDLNGDGKDDVLLRHTDGTWSYYPMNGREFLAGQRGAAFLTSNLEWQFAGIGDLNGDGKDDVLVRRVTDGRWYYYPMDGRRHLVDQRGGAGIVSDLSWQLAGIGDLNGDGKDDVLLRHREDGRWLYYPMDGREFIAGGRGTANITRDLAWTTTGVDASTPPEQPVVVDDTPDLVVDTPSVSASTPVAEETFTLRVTVRNRGEGAAGATTLRYYRSADSTITTGDSAQGTEPVGTLSASGTSSVSVTLTAPAVAGTYYYGACVDAVSGESDTGNNCSSGVRVTVSDGGGSGDDHGDTRAGATGLALGSSASGQIEPGNDVDYFSVQVSGTGTLTVYTTGSLDTLGDLENSSGGELAGDDDSGDGRNFRIEHDVSSGTYYIKVGSFLSHTGSYTIHVEFAGSGDMVSDDEDSTDDDNGDNGNPITGTEPEQECDLLVTNIGSFSGGVNSGNVGFLGDNALGNRENIQSFVTGGDEGGYVVHAVEVPISGGARRNTISLTINRGMTPNAAVPIASTTIRMAGTPAGALSQENAEISETRLVFTFQANLQEKTWYHLAMSSTSGELGFWGYTVSVNESSCYGWRIGNSSSWRILDSTPRDVYEGRIGNRPLRFEMRGRRR